MNWLIGAHVPRQESEICVEQICNRNSDVYHCLIELLATALNR